MCHYVHMNVHVQYESGTPQEYVEAAELAYQMLGNATNENMSFAARPLELDLPTLASGQYDSAWIERVRAEPGTSFLVVTARDLGAVGLNFCYGRSAFNQGALIASSNRVSPPAFAGLVLHEGGHSLGLVEPSEKRHDSISGFIGHCSNSCVMEPVNTTTEMDDVIQKVMTRPHGSGFCAECASDLAARH